MLSFLNCNRQHEKFNFSSRCLFVEPSLYRESDGELSNSINDGATKSILTPIDFLSLPFKRNEVMKGTLGNLDSKVNYRESLRSSHGRF